MCKINIVKRVKSKLGYSNKDIAELLGISYSAVSKFANSDKIKYNLYIILSYIDIVGIQRFDYCESILSIQDQSALRYVDRFGYITRIINTNPDYRTKLLIDYVSEFGIKNELLLKSDYKILRKVRKQLELTQQEMSNLMGFNNSQNMNMSNYEHNRVEISPILIVVLNYIDKFGFKERFFDNVPENVRKQSDEKTFSRSEVTKLTSAPWYLIDYLLKIGYIELGYKPNKNRRCYTQDTVDKIKRYMARRKK